VSQRRSKTPVPLREATGCAHADLVVDVTAKAPSALGQALALVKPGGTVVVAGTRGSADTPGFWPDLIVYKEVRIQGALGVDVAAYRVALDLLASGRYPFDELPRRVVDFDAMEDLLRAMGGETPTFAGAPVPVHGVLAPAQDASLTPWGG
jgi:alcohol dehydrogenase